MLFDFRSEKSTDLAESGPAVSISISPAASPAASTTSMASVASNAKSSSTMALDVIEEDPEHVVPGSGNQDEEMMSQVRDFSH